jgi:polar amino acid transport system permease protein
MSTIDIIAKYREGLIAGLRVTVEMSLIIWAIGLLIGSILGFLSARLPNSVGRIVRACSFIFAGIPILVLLMWLHYPAQSLLGVVVPPFWTAVTAISLINVLTVSEIVRPAVRQFPEEYLTAAKVCGVRPTSAVLRIQLPLILRQTVPALLLSQVTMLQATLFASLISVNEIFRVAQQINALEYRPVQIYTALAIFFLIVCVPLNGLAMLLQSRFSRNLSER